MFEGVWDGGRVCSCELRVWNKIVQFWGFYGKGVKCGYG